MRLRLTSGNNMSVGGGDAQGLGSVNELGSETVSESQSSNLRLFAIKQSSKMLIQRYNENQEKSFERKYSLGEKIGEGMHSSVYKCTLREDTGNGGTFAVKITRNDDEEKKNANRNEFEMTKDLNHRNILKVHEIFENDVTGEMHLVMQYIEGIEILDQIAD